MHTYPSRHWSALPLGLQLLGILIGSLVVAQLVTLGLTVAIPPAPTLRWNLDEVAGQLAGEPASNRLERRRMAGPPDITDAGWLVSESSREALATKLGRPAEEVVLAFYTQLPVGGITVPVDGRRVALSDDSGKAPSGGWLVDSAQAQGMPGGPPPGGIPGGGFPGGGFPGGMPGGGAPGGSVGRPGGNPASRTPSPPVAAPHQPSQPTTAQPGGPPNPGAQPGQPGFPNAPAPVGAPPANGLPTDISAPPAISQTAPRPLMAPIGDLRSSAAITRQPAPPSVVSSQASVARPEAPTSSVLPTSPTAAPRTNPLVTAVEGLPQRVPFRQSEGLLSFASPPFIEGDFIAAARQPDGTWMAVAPTAEPFPNRWQQRVMLWFALSLLIVAPLAWLFARRIVKPLERFAQTAELLGRDPAASVLPLSGPAEIGRAARAFNIMHTRLRAFVDDRTTMIGAISHDLRTPLTRLRFRIEDVPDDQRDALLREVEEMEEMINQVIGFIRDASTPGPRQRVDFAELVESSVEDAQVLGGKVRIEAVEHGLVEVDPLGMRRLLGNLLENALKYGENARVRVSLQGHQAVAEIIDDGPGIPAEERDQAFEPFYRGALARDSEKPGSGLGLAVCRSIARAHGGDVNLEQRSEGFIARVAVPLSFDERLPRAA